MPEGHLKKPSRSDLTRIHLAAPITNCVPSFGRIIFQLKPAFLFINQNISGSQVSIMKREASFGYELRLRQQALFITESEGTLSRN
jgi:hypothetical protein